MTLQFQRNPYRPEMRTVWAAWNRIVVLDSVVLRLGDSGDSLASGPGDRKQSNEKPQCRIDEMEMIQPSVVESQDAEFQHQSGGGRQGLLLADKQVLQEVVPIPELPDYKLVYRLEKALNYHSLLRLQLTPAGVSIPAQLGYVHSLRCQGHLKDLRLPPGFHGIRYNYDGLVNSFCNFASLH